MMRSTRALWLFAAVTVFAASLAAIPASAHAAADDFFPGVTLPSSPVNGTLGGDDDLDIYNFTLAPGDELQVSLSGDAGTDFDLWLESPTGVPGETALIATSEQYSYAESIGWLVPQGMAGTYYLIIADAGGVSGDYTLTWTKTNDATARLAGADRTATAAAISRSTFATASTVVLATSTGYADALAASGLAGTIDGPLLLTPRDGLTTHPLNEIIRLAPSKVYIVGGTGALSDSLMPEITEALGYAPAYERLSGADRFGTAAEVAREIASLGGTTESVFLVTGLDFADAVSIAPLAFSQRMPILLTRPTALPGPTSAAFSTLGPDEVFVVGGTGAVSADVVTALGVPSERWGGSNRYQTSRLVADGALAEGWATYAHVGFATGTNFPDALAGGTWSGRNGGVLLLTTPTALHPEAAAVLTGHAGEVQQAVLFGGSGVLSTAVQSAIESILSGSTVR